MDTSITSMGLPVPRRGVAEGVSAAACGQKGSEGMKGCGEGSLGSSL